MTKRFARAAFGLLVASLTILVGLSADARALSARALETMDRLIDARPSPDGRAFIYLVRSVDPTSLKVTTAAWMRSFSANAPAPVRVQALRSGDGSVQWTPDSRAIYFLSDRGGSAQVWMSKLDGAAPVQVTDLPLPVESFRIGGDTLVASLSVLPGVDDLNEVRKRLDAARASPVHAAAYDHLFVRHWDQWNTGAVRQLFALRRGDDGSFKGARAVPLMKGVDGETAWQPFGDDGEYDISADGRWVAFTLLGPQASRAWRLEGDIWLAPADGSSPPRDLTAFNPAADNAPRFSPDGKRLAWLAARRPGDESDSSAVWVIDLASGAAKPAAEALDISADAPLWACDGDAVLFTGNIDRKTRLFRADLNRRGVQSLVDSGSVASAACAGHTLTYLRSSLTEPLQAYVYTDGKTDRRITEVGLESVRGAHLPTPEPFEFPGWNNETVHGYLFRPEGLRPGQKAPVVLMLHGGPESNIADAWSYRWNPAVWTGWGVAVVTIEYHGSAGYGRAFMDAVVGHWGDRPLEDLKRGWTYVLDRYPMLDGQRACVAGASFGGYLAYWIESQWKEPWRCQIAHSGVFDTRVLAFSTDELWFTEWELGAPAWRNSEALERFNPSRFTDRWTTPMLILHGQRDFRVSDDQGIGAFSTLQRRGVPSRYVTFEDASHWVLRPADSIFWHENVHDWLARWLDLPAEPAASTGGV